MSAAVLLKAAFCDPGRSKTTTVLLTVCSKRNLTPAASQASLMRGMPVPYCSMTPARNRVRAIGGVSEAELARGTV